MEFSLLVVLPLLAFIHVSSSMQPSCPSRVYCQGPLLHDIQMSRLFNGSKVFVDMHMIKSENETVNDYEQLLQKYGNLTQDQIKVFVNGHFVNGSEFMDWTPNDFVEEPKFLEKINDPIFRKFAKEIVAIWPNLTRRVSPDVEQNPDRHSLIPLPNGFVIPGGRFKEIYYWDSYWIIEGLILSEMTETAKGMIENLMYLVKKFGHVPNGSRVYYNARSQPPLLTAMVSKYIAATNNIDWLAKNIEILEEELKFWIDERIVEVTRNNKTHRLLRYFAESEGPRPESYVEDYTNSLNFVTEEERQEFYTNMKSAAESGWDFSSRWFIAENGSNEGTLKNIKTEYIIPVDLNAIYAGALQTLGDLYVRLNDRRSAITWWSLASYWRQAIDDILWDNEDGVWYDYNLERQELRKYFYPSNVAPFWTQAVHYDKIKEYAPRVVKYLENNPSMQLPGGIPASGHHTSQQWDHPNAWPPLQSVVILALKNTQIPLGQELAKSIAQKWVRSNYEAYNKYHELFEKYDATQLGGIGGGGEYEVQSGFGWTNGVILEILNIYGGEISAYDSLNSSQTFSTVEKALIVVESEAILLGG